MDDSCAVCAETLEWVSYGPCGHREVCSTCVARLRFICDDRRCCICKSESPIVFATKALGDYTRMINDFAALPSELREGQVLSYWYHEDTQALFDDVDQYKMIKAMCRLSCSVCDKIEEQPNDGSKRKGRFRNIEQLKGHLFHRHKLFMCSLCLGGRKVFICEQKLYTRAQLNRHICTGDSEVDGSESERGGFMGHPMCEFCRNPFYGDNELYSHMSTEHYTCHMCQRQHPGQYEYYKNYDDLEIHFRREHFLCEDEACLAKKFIVFQSEAEMKRHNTIEHGGRMSRSKRSAALQLPTSFRYQRFNEQDRRRGRGQMFRRDHTGNQRRVPIEVNFVTANSEGQFHDPSMSSSSVPAISDHGETREIDPIVQPLDSSATSDNEQNPRYLQALSQHSRNQPLRESSFPPLSTAQINSQQEDRQDSEGLPKNTMAAYLRRQNNRMVTIPNSGPERPGTTNRSFGPSDSDFPPVSATQMQKLARTNHVVPTVEDVRTANKSLVEQIRGALEFDENKYTSFRNISGEYRQGSISTEEYLACVQQYGLTHLVHDLATLLPDPQKQKELVETHKANLKSHNFQESSLGNDRIKGSKGSKKGKGKRVDAGDSSRPRDALADSVLSTVRELQLNCTSPEAEVEVLSKDGYRSGRGTLKESEAAVNQNLGLGTGGSKQRKKTSKFLRARLGDGSVSALLDPKGSSDPDLDPDPDPYQSEEMMGGDKNPTQGFPVRGAWRNGGGQRLLGVPRR